MLSETERQDERTRGKDGAKEGRGTEGKGGPHLVRALSTKPAGRRGDAAPLGRRQVRPHVAQTPRRAAVNKGPRGDQQALPREEGSHRRHRGETTTAVTRARDVRAGDAGACHSRPRLSSCTTQRAPPSSALPSSRPFTRQIGSRARGTHFRTTSSSTLTAFDRKTWLTDGGVRDSQ